MEKLAHLIEQQHGATFVKAFLRPARYACVNAECERSEGRNAHKQVFVKHLPVNDTSSRFEQDVVTNDDIHRKVEEKRQQPAVPTADRRRKPYRLVDDEHDKKHAERNEYAD